MIRFHRVLAGCLLAVSASGQAAPASEDFAYGIRLVTDGQGGIYQLSVPAEVYASVVSPGLSDVRVFNAAGEPVPHLMRTPSSGSPEAERVVSVPFFPLRGEADAENPRLTVTTNDDGSVVSIQREGGGDDPGPATSAYLLDLSALERPVAALRLAVAAGSGEEKGLNARLTVSASDDLGDWRTLRRGAPLVRLDYQGHRLERTSVDLPASEARYLRVSWPQAARDHRLTGVEVLLRESAEAPLQHWLTPSATLGEDDATYLYDTGGRFPVRRVDVRPDYDNAVLDVHVDSRADPAAEWQRRFGGEIYRIQLSGTTLETGPQRLAPTSDRYWRLRLTTPGAGGPAPALRLGWRPERLYFVAQGPAPYTLAFGSAAQSDGPRLNTLSTGLLDAARETDDIGAARAGERLALGGPERLQPARAPLPWTRILLWGLLLAAVAVLAFMAWRLYRQLGGADAA